MNIKEINSLVKYGESKALEFKTSTTQLKSAFETICAFLNGQGGKVLIGVKNDGQLIGQHVTDATRQEIAREISKLEPSTAIEIDYINLQKDKFVIAFTVSRGNHLPYTYEGRAFQRNESTTSRMTQHGYEQLLIERGNLNYSWEKSIAVGKTVGDLDFEEIRKAVKQGINAGRIPETAEHEDIEGILASWDLIKEGKINNAAMVLFAKKVKPDYMQCHLKAARFRGNDKMGDYIDNQDFYGNAFYLFREANNFIMRHLPIASFFETNNLQRIDKPALPVLAVREALVNAICHKDYFDQSSAITLAIFDDRMEIWNNGKLPFSLNMDNLNKKHQSKPRNQLIAKVFYDRKYFEGWGTGINKIFDLCRENDVPDPEYEEYSGGVEIIFKFKEPIGFSASPENNFSEYSLTIRQKNILNILKRLQKMTVSEITKKLENAPATRTVGDDLAYLRKLKLVDLEGFGRGSKWFLILNGAEKGR